MKTPLLTIRELDFSLGIDAESPEFRIPDKYLESTINFDPLPSGILQTRKGYQGRAGDLPVRVNQIQYTSDTTKNIILTLDSSIFLTPGRSQPLVIAGKTSGLNTANVGDFLNSTNATKYYTGYASEIRQTLLTGTNTLNIPASTHGAASPLLLTNLYLSTSLSTFDMSQLAVSTIEVNKATRNVAITYTNSTGAAKSAIFFAVSNDTTTDVSYAGSTTASDATETINTGSHTYTIPFSVHGLSNNQVRCSMYIDTGTVYRLFSPSSLVIDIDTGDITVTINNRTGSSFNAIFVIRSLPVANVLTDTAANGETKTLSLPISGVSGASDFLDYACYQVDSVTGDLTLANPSSMSFSDATQTYSFTFINNSGSGKTFSVLYDYVSVAINKLTVSGSVIGGGNVFTDIAPQLVVYGLFQSAIYGDNPASRAGWVSYIDSYTSVGTSQLLCGLGGNIFSEQNQSVTLYPRLQTRVNTDAVVGPAFYLASDSPTRTRGYIKSASATSDHKLPCTSIVYNSGTGYIDYTCTLSSLVVSGSPISSTSMLEDWLTVEQTNYSVNSGTFKIKSFSSDATHIIISVSNSARVSSIYNESNSGSLISVLTDQLTFTDSTSPFITGDILANFHSLIIQSASGQTNVVSGLTSVYSAAANLKVCGTRTSSLLPLRNSAATATVANLVDTDMCSFTGINRQVRVLHINPNANETVSSITGTGTIATVTIADTSAYLVGRKLLIRNSVDYTGEHTVLSIVSGTQLTFSSTGTSTDITAVIVGNIVELDESLTYSDSATNANMLSVVSRWAPIEIPTNSFDTTTKTRVSTFSSNTYTNQNILRSTMSQDNMYMTNYADEVMKYDGTSVYRAGLPRWQPGAFLDIDTSASGKIVIETIAVAFTASDTNKFQVSADDLKLFNIGDAVSNSRDALLYSIVNTHYDGTKFWIIVDRQIQSSTGSGTLTRTVKYNYYFRLNAVDANSNIIASAVTSSNDFTAVLTGDAAVRIRLIGLPALDTYDYNRLEVQIYRTKANSSGPFYLIADLPLNFNRANAYIDFLDTYTDIDLINLDKTAVLTGDALGTGFSHPLRAKCITTLQNQLIYGNVKSFPQLDIVLKSAQNILLASTFYASTNKLWKFKKDSTDSATTTDMVNRANYEWVNAANATLIRPLYTNSTITFVDTGIDALTIGADIPTGNIVQITGSDLPAPLVAGTDYWTIRYDATRIQLATSAANAAAGTQIDITTSGSGAQTISYKSSITASADHFVVSKKAHGLVAGNWVYLFHTELATSTPVGDRHLTYAGWHMIRSVNTNDFTIYANLSSTSVTHSDVDGYITATVKNDIPVPIGLDGNFGMDNGNRVIATDPYEFLAVRRLATAINATMRNTDLSVAGMSAFVPWMTAGAGNEYLVGQIFIEQPKVYATTISVTIPSLSGDFNVYVNNSQQTGGTTVAAETIRFPSRILISYANYPELFSSPLVASDSDSVSVVDVNAADGQEITGIMPFFSRVVFSLSYQATAIVVFKTNSIYLVDLTKKASGEFPLQKIDSRGLGCTAPYSIALSRNGIMFANEFGVWRLNRTFEVDPIGRKLKRTFEADADIDNIAMFTGHNSAIFQGYKLSYTKTGQSANSGVFWYSNIQEYDSQTQFGAWGLHDNIPSIGWATLVEQEFFASTSGRVFIIRNNNEAQDYRDDASSITGSFTLRAIDGGDSGRRKMWDKIVSHFKTLPTAINQMTLSSAIDLDETFHQTDNFIVLAKTGSSKKGSSFISSLQQRNGVYLQLKYVISALDMPVEFVGCDYRVAIRQDKGIQQAADTASGS